MESVLEEGGPASTLTKWLLQSYFEFMRAVGIKVLKNKLSEYVRLAQGGETVLVTDRDRVVAELRPARPDRATWLADAQLAEAVRKGWVTPPTEPSTEPPEGLPIAPLAELLAELQADREDR